MPIIPIRGVGELGVVADISPQDLPWKAWNDARNVRFSEGKLSRYSFFKRLAETYDYGIKVPVGIVDGGAPGDEGYVVTVFNDGTMEQWFSGAVTAVTPLGTLALNQEQITVSKLGGVTYMSRPGDTPVYREFPADGVFTAIPGWTPGDTTRSMRAYKDFLIAIDVTKAGVRFPGMVKWSDAVQAGAPPANWDTADPASLAGETVLNDLTGFLVDGSQLGDSFIVYGQNQTFRMDFIGAPFVFRFLKIFDDQGMIARNCAVEHEGKHFVFGRSDIYVHDGIAKQSISNGLVQRRVFSEIDFEKRDRCFVYHDKFQGEIGFAYPSSDETASWQANDVFGCNRAAVFNYRSNTWTFVDLPGVVGWTEVSLNTPTDWTTVSDEGWGNSGAAWSAFSSQKPRSLLFSGSGNTTILKPGQPYFLDEGADGRLTNVIDADIDWEAWAEALYKDVDDLGADIYGRKLIRRIVPQFRVISPGESVRIKVGSSRFISDDIEWGPEKTIFPFTDSKYDTRVNGRYLSLRVTIPSNVDADLGGYDIDLLRISGR